ncbi:hypothetical protein ACFQS3_23850 [Glycomyces mayteni]|uniref:Lipoprotein n=1 Tax=Glycomyces mayteni TaxID=543887 RepID=A0ABW2DCY8_9ACTN|nr:hypothetical protein GCM10025732_40460 [Glycomyces mayteni]
MIDVRLVKVFAWTIGVLLVLWMLAECAGGADGTDTDGDLQRDADRYAADCGRTWQALDAAGGAAGGDVESVVDEMEALGNEIEDPDLKALTAVYVERVQDLAATAAPEDLEGAIAQYQDSAAFDLALRCPLS